jgi:hypothetical protein
MTSHKATRKGILAAVDGLKPVKPEDIKEFSTAMNERVIPDIVKTVDDRRLAAAHVRLKQLKC